MLSLFSTPFGRNAPLPSTSLANGLRSLAWHEACLLLPVKLMAAARKTPAQRAGETVARGASWMSLLAAATLGITNVDQLRAHISSGDHVGEGDLRLIVQAYDKHALDDSSLPQRGALPLASSQRSITAEELKRGIDVSFLQFPEEGTNEPVVVAWVERGAPDLEFDALEARPTQSAYYGTELARAGNIVLRRGNG